MRTGSCRTFVLRWTVAREFVFDGCTTSMTAAFAGIAREKGMKFAAGSWSPQSLFQTISPHLTERSNVDPAVACSSLQEANKKLRLSVVMIHLIFAPW